MQFKFVQLKLKAPFHPIDVIFIKYVIANLNLQKLDWLLLILGWEF
jgi:hypothetical protein